MLTEPEIKAVAARLRAARQWGTLSDTEELLLSHLDIVTGRKRPTVGITTDQLTLSFGDV
jgi:hypothetical protein